MKIDKIFKIISGNGKYTEAYLVLHHGDFPVLSGKTKYNGVFGYIDSYDYDLPKCLSYSKDGEHSGTIFIQEGKLSLTSHVNILLLRKKYEKKVNLLWFKYKYEPIFKSLVRGKFGIPSLPSEIVKRIDVKIPSLEVQNRELIRFENKEGVCESLKLAIYEIDNRIKELKQMIISVNKGISVSGEKLLEPLRKNTGLTEKFLYDYSDPTDPIQIPVYNGALTPSGFLPYYSLAEIKKKLIVYKKNEAILIVRKGVKAGTVFLPQDEQFIVGEDIVAVRLRKPYINKVDLVWFVREFYKTFRQNTTGEEGSATFSLLKMNKITFRIPSITVQKKMVEKYNAVDSLKANLLSVRNNLNRRLTMISQMTLK